MRAEQESESLRETLAFHGYRSLERLAMALPEEWGRALFRAGGVLLFHAAPGARRTVQRNLSRVLGRDPDDPLVRAAAQESFLSYSRYWYDTFRVRMMPDREFVGRFRIEGRENLEAAVEGGLGGVLALPHLGNWDAAGKWVHLQGWRITAVAELLRPETDCVALATQLILLCHGWVLKGYLLRKGRTPVGYATTLVEMTVNGWATPAGRRAWERRRA